LSSELLLGTRSIMKSWKQKGLWPSIGLMIEDRQISLSVVATTSGGRKEIFRDAQSCEDGGQAAVLEQMLAPWTAPKGALGRKPARGSQKSSGPWVQIALPESRVFQAVVPVTNANRSSPPQAFFMEATQAINMRAEERVIDLVKLDLNKRPLACLAAGQRLLITELVETLSGLGTRVAMIEAAPASLFRAGVCRKREPRGSKLTIRFFLGRTQAIGVLAAGVPLLWHTFDLPEDDVTRAIMGTYSTLWMQGRYAGIGVPIDTVIVHGRSELDLGIKPEAFREKTGARLIRHGSPDYERSAIALGTALAAPLTESTDVNLARTFRPMIPIREIFPWGELILQSLLVAGVTMFLHGKAVELDTQLKTTEVQLHTFPWLKEQDRGKLDAEKKLLDDQLKALESFESSRVDWSNQLKSIATHIPETTVVTSFQGTGELPEKGRASTRNQMVVNFTTPMGDDGEIPQEINEFITALRVEPAMKKYFPTIDVSGVQAKPGKAGQKPNASYSVICKPGPTTKEEAPKTAAGKRR
jgi:hypothetical protein